MRSGGKQLRKELPCVEKQPIRQSENLRGSFPLKATRHLAALATFVACFAGCSNLPRHANQPLVESTASFTRARLEPKIVQRCTTALDGKNEFKTESVFIGVAISGGGSRAANFSAAVLIELDAIGLLAHVDAISSVSGST
jgi:NTE family protein